MELHTKKSSDFSLNIETIKQTHKIMMDKEKQRMEKISSWENIENRLYLQAIIFLHQLALLKDVRKTHDDPIMAATSLFGNIINIHPFEDGNGRICHLILAHVLMQKKCCLFPVILRQKTLHKGNKDVR